MLPATRAEGYRWKNEVASKHHNLKLKVYGQLLSTCYFTNVYIYFIYQKNIAMVVASFY